MFQKHISPEDVGMDDYEGDGDVDDGDAYGDNDDGDGAKDCDGDGNLNAWAMATMIRTTAMTI